jgi:hypothetical protein
MDLGLGNRNTLKRYLLAASLVTATTYDAVLNVIGKGVATQFDRAANRKFKRVAGDTFVFYADRRVVVLPRYPIESVTAIAQKTSEAEGFVALDLALIQSIDHAGGLIQFAAPLGTFLSTVRVTYTGGYWFDTKEPDDDGYVPDADAPAGATVVPDDLKLAWLQQCARVWELKDKLGTGITKTGGDATFVAQTLGALEIIPDVKAVLRSYTRFN